MLLVIALVIVFVLIVGLGAVTLTSRRSRRRSRAPVPEASPAAPRNAGAEAPPAARTVSPEGPLEASARASTAALVGTVPPSQEAPPEVLERPRFRDRLGRARAMLAGQLAGLRGRSKLDQEAWEELEEALILADVGVATVGDLLQELGQAAREDALTGPDQLVSVLRQQLVSRLEGDRELHRAEAGATTVWLFVGVNGVGKTTTIGKVAMQEQAEGRKVVMAAGDTFRAAAADQLQLWSERTGAGFVRGLEGGDPGAVVFDAVQHAAARGIPLVLADTAGRLHTKANLMEELKKVRRVADRAPGSVTEVLLVIDATTGQNGLVQARQFTDAVGVTGVVLTKLDGTAKGGIAVAITSELGIPIKLVGLGEGPGDLVPFDAQEFVDALLPAD
ncbi:MAG TPA: signal recognition particle-docking protein FtsY [Acidimicrobiales bacterium]|nr:signal recognition particle-docking protein FtsY [Acidimicrobiales bacterium]